MPDITIGSLLAALRTQQTKVQTLESQQQELLALVRQSANAPKWIENIPGVRSPYFAVVEITIAANSTSKVEGTFSVSTDGPFVVTAIGMWFQRTSSPYNGLWAPATTVDLAIAPASQQHGFGYLFDKPVCGSFDVELAESGSDRNWQNAAFSSALFSPSVGGLYVLPTANMFGRSSVVTVRVTPTVAQTVAGKVQTLLLGYKILQGNNYQP